MQGASYREWFGPNEPQIEWVINSCSVPTALRPAHWSVAPYWEADVN